MNLRAFCRLWETKGARRAMLVLLALALVGTVVLGTERAVGGSTEFRAFRRIVQVGIVADEDHYEKIVHLRAYPPFFAIFWAPFGMFPAGLLADRAHPLSSATAGQAVQLAISAALVLTIMSVGTVWVVRLVMGAVARGSGPPAGSCSPALLWLLCGGLMLNATCRCETDMLIVLLLAGGMYLAFAADRQELAGALLGVATAVKLTPALFGIYLVCRRKWRAAAGMVAAGAVCTFLLPAMVWGLPGAVQRTRSWVDKVLIPYATAGPERFISRPYRDINQSPRAALERYLSPYNARTGRPGVRDLNLADLSPRTIRSIAVAVKLTVLALLLAAWLIPPVQTRGALEPLLFGLVPLGMLLISDVSHGSHLAMLVVPVGALCGFAFEHAGDRLGRMATRGVLAGALLANLIAVQLLKELAVGTAGITVLFCVLLCLTLRLGLAERRARRPAAA